MSNDRAFFLFLFFFIFLSQISKIINQVFSKELFYFFSVSITDDCVFSAALIQSILYHLLQSQTKLNGIVVKFQLKYFQNSSSIKIGYLS